MYKAQPSLRKKNCKHFSETNLLIVFILSTLFKHHEKKNEYVPVLKRYIVELRLHCRSGEATKKLIHSSKRDTFPLAKNTLVIFHGLQLCVISVSSFIFMKLEKKVYYRNGNLKDQWLK